ncbi:MULTISPECIES: NAD(P)H-hydrate dehydratase [unclassified Haematobacter]|uniref:NAD(P)H-hydrate dehydratase n=1 Tax=unclassified Haematobacter TaxID=2640585 RepID=UPI0025B9F332|nr:MULTISPECIES: NAD(P)H-hydrate dehydratase [unclassified Haematobacter]
MTEVLTSAQMRAIEDTAFRSGAATPLDLMERAGQGVVAAILEEGMRRGGLPRRALVACGPGNNGGDGYVVARLLHGLGWQVEAAHFGVLDRMSPAAAENFRRWRQISETSRWEADSLAQQPPGVVIDAVYGIGFRGLWDRPPVLELLDRLSRREGWLRVAVDIASGVDADTGRQGAEIAPMDLTVTFHAPKRGHLLLPGAEIAGRLAVVDIGLRPENDAWRGDLPPVRRLERPEADTLDKATAGHKFRHGHALILCGPAGTGGAARLAARSALRVGAGLVTLVCPPEAVAENAARLDAVMIRAAAELPALLADRRVTALCLGPGFGVARAASVLAQALTAPAVVLDADALTALAERREVMPLATPAVLTPHEGEFARLFPDLGDRLAQGESRVDLVREAAARAGATVLLKGAVTVIAEPSGAVWLHAAVAEEAAPWLATAGSGDVLAGLIAGLLARGFPPGRAARTAVWLHADAARRFGPGLIAEDLPDRVPECLRALGVGAKRRGGAEAR